MTIVLSTRTENLILKDDMHRIYEKLSESEKDRLRNSTILLTGCGGFLGYYFMHFFAHFAEELEIKRIIGLDNFLTGTKDWLVNLTESNPNVVSLHEFNVITDSVEDIPGADEADLVIHMASIASPTFYRIYPIETLDANITGLRRLLGLLFGKIAERFPVLFEQRNLWRPFP